MKKSIIIGIIVLVLVIVAASAMYTVEENQYACIFRFSEIVSTTDTAGLHFKIPFIDKVEYFTKATQLYDIPPSEVLTSDKQNMTVDCYILWSITDPQQFYRSLGTVAKAEDRLDAITYNALKTAMGTLAQKDIINEDPGAERNEIYESIAKEVDKQAATYGIHVEDVKIKHRVQIQRRCGVHSAGGPGGQHRPDRPLAQGAERFCLLRPDGRRHPL